MRKLRTWTIIAVGAMALAACSSGDDGGSATPTTTAPATDGATDEQPGATEVPDAPDDGVTATEIKIGWMGDLTGPTVAAQGLNFAGSEAAVAWYNENGGVLGRQLVLIEKDDQYGAEVAATNYSALINDDKVLALLNMGGSHISTALIPNMESDGIALIGPAQTIDAQIDSPNIFNNLAHYGDQADVAVQYMGEQLGGIDQAVVAVVHLEVPSGSEWNTYIQAELEEGGGTYVGAIPLSPASPDYAGTVTRLRQMISNDGVNFVAFHASPAQALGLATELASQAVDVPVIGIQGIAASSIFQEGPPEAGDQFLGVHSFLPSTGDCEMCLTIQEFVAGTEWEAASTEANFTHGWLDIMITVQAIERAAADSGEVTRATLIDALNGTFDTGGLSCPIDWSTSTHSPCAAPFQWNSGESQLEVVEDFDFWADAIDGDYGLFEG
jgi:branched-chain amino acid transport system substrate-binding protein